ncbi:MAG: hypothetical protein GEU83_03215 [Pseudonocardiaceae bacterium]|nr:hypothetical protein [Pseudonocardiaceae bacterium]
MNGLPALAWGRADRGELATVRQLRELGLRPAGAQPVAVLVFGHRQPDGLRPAIEYASLYRIAEAAPKRTATPAQRQAIEKALAARRTCRDCGQEQDYYLPTSERRCWPCSEAADARGHDGDQAERGAVDVVGDDESDGWWRVVHDAAMRAEDPHRAVTEHDVTVPDATGADLDDPGAGEADGSVSVPAQRTELRATAPVDNGAEAARDARKLDPLDEKKKGPEATAEPSRIEDDPAASAREETARAVGQARCALTRLAHHHTAADLAGAERARAGRLSQWHADDRAAEQRQRAAEDTDELEGSLR